MSDERVTESRLSEEYLVSFREQIGETYATWKARVQDVDALLRGEWPVLKQGERREVNFPLVQNVAETFVRDLGRIVAEVTPTPRSPAKNDTDRETQKALVRAQVAETHWQADRGPLMVPLWAMDLAVTGAAFAVSWVDRSPYPRFMRVDPRFCYPDVFNGQLQELLVVQRVKRRVAERLFPDLDLGRAQRGSDTVEIWDLYCYDEVVKAVAALGNNGKPLGPGGVRIVKRWRHDLGVPPAAMVQLPSPDGRIVGMLDQVGGSLVAKNRIVQLLVDYMDQLVHSPLVMKNVLNPEDPPGPRTIYQLDPTSESGITRLQMPGVPPEVLSIIGFLDTQERGGLAYPASRQGEVRQSIASAAFVASTQGSLTSLVRQIQMLLGDLRQQIHRVGFQLDERYLDREKPLYRPVGNQATYRPTKDIDGRHEIEIVYGVGAGLDRLNADVRLLQFRGAGIVSDETVRANVEFLTDPQAEPDRIEREEVARAIRQRFLTDPNISFDFIAEVLTLQRRDGLSLVDAVAKVRERMAAERERQAQQAEQLPQPEQAPPAAEQQVALSRGAVPQPVPLPAAFQPPPLEQVLVRGGG
jgi:hypothetical protein